MALQTQDHRKKERSTISSSSKEVSYSNTKHSIAPDYMIESRVSIGQAAKENTAAIIKQKKVKHANMTTIASASPNTIENGSEIIN